MISFTEYMNRSLNVRNKITTFCINNGYEAQETRNHLHLLDAFDTESEKNCDFRIDVMKWFNKKHSTLKLRDLSYIVGYNYWDSLKNSNIIDTYDAIQHIL